MIEVHIFIYVDVEVEIGEGSCQQKLIMQIAEILPVIIFFSQVK